jgi:hypothetical protein
MATPHIDDRRTVDSGELIFDYEYLCGFEAKMEQVFQQLYKGPMPIRFM